MERIVGKQERGVKRRASGSLRPDGTLCRGRHLRGYPTTPCSLASCKLDRGGLTQYRIRRCHSRATAAGCGKSGPTPAGDQRQNLPSDLRTLFIAPLDLGAGRPRQFGNAGAQTGSDARFSDLAFPPRSALKSPAACCRLDKRESEGAGDVRQRLSRPAIENQH